MEMEVVAEVGGRAGGGARWPGHPRHAGWRFTAGGGDGVRVVGGGRPPPMIEEVVREAVGMAVGGGAVLQRGNGGAASAAGDRWGRRGGALEDGEEPTVGGRR
jgi:hypothetical protein